MQRRFGAIDAIQITHPTLDCVMPRNLSEVPVEADCWIPFTPLRKLRSHEEQLFTRLNIHAAEEQSQICKALPLITSHPRQQGTFTASMTSLRQRKDKALSESVVE